ncbi:MAG: nitrilase-related carbon-nitrogen hydrolase [Candidatus Aminicenantia bacterium]
MRVALAQISSFLGNLEKNLQKHEEYVKRSLSEKADIVIFPELSLTGYLLQDLVPEVAISIKKNRILDELKSLSREISIIAGYVEEKERGLYYNSASFFLNGEILHTHRKLYLPTFGLFDEKKFFSQGKELRSFNSPFGKTGLLICRDFMHVSTSYLYYLQNVDFIITISASPARGAGEEAKFYISENWEMMGKFVSKFFNVFCVYVNKVGFEDGLGFIGGSFVCNPEGELFYLAPYMDEAFEVVEIDPEDVRRARAKAFFRRDELDEIIFLEMERIVKRVEIKS